MKTIKDKVRILSDEIKASMNAIDSEVASLRTGMESFGNIK